MRAPPGAACGAGPPVHAPAGTPTRLDQVSVGPSLYRRHRPRTFADVVGQEHVVRTLQNAVERDKVHHAYLFVGSRGTGKTSMAKILAACLNCVNGPTTEPCGQCESCLAIASATSLDVIEMDAASNNSVDDIRDLREKVAYAPVSGRHKVYILDEAHMLSTQAWNAFLKTLEEPPPRTIFVLATTEAQKVLPTVVDRCHRFDFAARRWSRSRRSCAGWSDREASMPTRPRSPLIARHATGSFRDALGTLEQLVTYAGERRIEPADVLAVLGITDSDAALRGGRRDRGPRARAGDADGVAALGRFRPRSRTGAARPRGPRPRAAGGPDPRRRPRRAPRHARARRRLAAQANALASSSDAIRLIDLVAQAPRRHLERRPGQDPARASAGQGRRARV